MVLNGKTSEWKSILAVVPQESVLNFYFLLYVIDDL